MIATFNDVHTKVAYFGRNMVVNDKELMRKLQMRSDTNNERKVYINPVGSFIRFWRLLNSGLLIYNATSTPFRVAFHTSKSSNFLVSFELFMDFIFFIDIVLSFMIPYQRIDGSYEENLNKIAKRYVRHEIFFDLIAAFPTVAFEISTPLGYT